MKHWALLIFLHQNRGLEITDLAKLIPYRFIASDFISIEFGSEIPKILDHSNEIDCQNLVARNGLGNNYLILRKLDQGQILVTSNNDKKRMIGIIKENSFEMKSFKDLSKAS